MGNHLVMFVFVCAERFVLFPIIEDSGLKSQWPVAK